MPNNIASMISGILSQMTVRTVGDAVGKKGLVSREVSQGSPLSSSLFYLYMYSYTIQLEETMRTKWITAKDRKLTLISDGAKLVSSKADALQTLLDTLET